MKFKLVAEGVETKEQLKTTNELGATLIQGFLFARPMPALQVPNFIATHEKTKRPRVSA